MSLGACCFSFVPDSSMGNLCAERENQNLALDGCKTVRAQTEPSKGVGHIIEMSVNYGTTQITKTDARRHCWPHPVRVEGKC